MQFASAPPRPGAAESPSFGPALLLPPTASSDARAFRRLASPISGTHRVRGCPSSSIMVGATERSRDKGEGRAGEGRGWGGRGGGLRAPAGDRGKGTEPCTRGLSPQPAPDTALQPGGAGGGGGWTKWPPPPARQETGQSAGAARQVNAQAGRDGL